jgi:hypothetical protein
MRYCYNCGKLTTGKPLFCNFCGRSYGIKLCPRLHTNPRVAEVCSQCGSRELSTPQPNVPLSARLIAILVWVIAIAGLVCTALILANLFLQEILSRTDVQAGLVGIVILIFLAAWLWSQVPLWFRKFVYRLLRRKGKQERERC